MTPPSIQNDIIEHLKQHQFDRYGFAVLKKPLSMSIYSEWINSGFAGSMEYLKAHEASKECPQKLLQNAQSAIVVGVDYIPHPHKSDFKLNLKTARYAQGQDYHNWLKLRLEKLCHELQKEYPNEVFKAYTDSAPVLERDLAYRAGLGWVGKNTCLINQQNGSLFFIGEIYTTLKISESVKLAEDRCGTCTRCIDACPTQALIAPRKMDARKCISYLTIESKEIPDVKLRTQIGDHYFGCDICQTVCPWNQKAWHSELTESQRSQEDIIQDLKFILTSSNKQIERFFSGTPLLRTPAWGHKRNALIVIANCKIMSLKEDVEKLCSNPRLGELALWTLKSLGCP